ncbi:MAG: hypothetical protein C3F14_02770, partial [Deltaproteobacteria bacterium]
MRVERAGGHRRCPSLAQGRPRGEALQAVQEPGPGDPVPFVIHRLEFEDLVRAALREDAPFGDPFGAAFPAPVRGAFLAGTAGVFCGGPVAAEVFRQVDASVSVTFVEEGRIVAAGERVGEAGGPAGSLLRGERVALNFLQRLSG